MINILFCGYRKWSHDVYFTLRNRYYFFDSDQFTLDLVISKEDFLKRVKVKKYNLIVFAGWSWIVPNDIVKDYFCICVHPSLLPIARGGSPVQNQIINGIKKTGVTIFKMDKGIDTGPIIFQKQFGFYGDANQIFDKIAQVSLEALIDIFNEYYNTQTIKTTPQVGEGLYFKRRSPEESEITIKEIQESTAEQLYDKIRCLNGQNYPNAYITGKDGKKLFLQKATLE